MRDRVGEDHEDVRAAVSRGARPQSHGDHWGSSGRGPVHFKKLGVNPRWQAGPGGVCTGLNLSR